MSIGHGKVGPGMTYREYVAAQALVGLLANYSSEDTLPDEYELASEAVAYADALIAELNGETPAESDDNFENEAE